jgi:DNA-binding NarL/FixJ family response regulator
MGHKFEPSGDRGAVLLAERDAARRDELAWALRSAGFSVVDVQESAQAFAQLTERVFDLLVCGVEFSERAGADLVREVGRRGIALSVIITTPAADLRLAVEVMRLGAVDLLVMPMALAEVIERVSDGVRKGKWARLLEEARLRVVQLAETADALDAAFATNPPSGSRLRAAVSQDDPLFGLDAAHLARLSPRERDIATRLTQGVAISEMAAQLGLSPNTVRNHVKSVFTKLQVRSQVALLTKLVHGRTSLAGARR